MAKVVDVFFSSKYNLACRVVPRYIMFAKLAALLRSYETPNSRWLLFFYPPFIGAGVFDVDVL